VQVRSTRLGRLDRKSVVPATIDGLNAFGHKTLYQLCLTYPSPMQQDYVTIQTPEHIQFTYELAGVGSRFLALLVDSLIQIVAVTVLGLLIAYLEALTGFAEGFRNTQIANIPLIPLLVLSSPVLFAIAYFIFFEMIGAGQPPGKRMAGMRVVALGGQRIGFAESAIRNILRLVDFLPALYTAGIFFVFFTSRYQRIGDLAAGTIVIKERLWEPPESRGSGAEAGDIVAPVDHRDKLVCQARSYLGTLSREELEVVRRFIQRRDELTAGVRTRLAEDIAARLYDKFPALATHQLSSEVLLEVIYQADRERQAQI